MRVWGSLRPAVAAAVLLLSAAAWSAAQFSAAPEYRSVSTKRGNVREEPREDAKIAWRMWKYFAVEILLYDGEWVKIRDFEGDEGWMHRAILDETPTVQVSTKFANLRKHPGGPIEWVLDYGYALRVFSRRGDWLEVSDLEEASGWIHESTVWGAKDPEKVRL